MAKYKLRTVEVIPVEAYQLTSHAMEHPIWWPSWLVKAWDGTPNASGKLVKDSDGNMSLHIATHDTDYEAPISPDDWIINGQFGLYICKHYAFTASYELAEA